MPLQKQFRGIHSWAGDYDLGQHTFFLGNTVTPVFDVNDFIEPPRLALPAAYPLSASSAGAMLDAFETPENEVRYLYWIGINSDAVNVTTYDVCPCIQLEDSSIVGIGEVESYTSSEFICRGWVFPKPVYVPPGADVGVLNVRLTAAGQPNLTVRASYQAFQV